jgi:hypothetical protein
MRADPSARPERRAIVGGRAGRRPWTRAALLASVLLGVAPGRGEQGREVFSGGGRRITEGRVFSVASSDVDHDGRPDLVVADYLHPARILYNDAVHTFTSVVRLTAGPETATSGHDVGLGDFNGDGHLDIFLVYNRGPSRILFGDGAGGFTDSGHAVGSPELSGTSVAVADVDQDGDPDVLVTYYRERARLYLNDGSGAFTPSDQEFFAGVAPGDIDGDGDIDIVSLRADGPAAIWSNTRGRFVLERRTVGDPDGVGHIELVDADADGDLDVIAAGDAIESTLWQNDGHGEFRRARQTFNPGTRVVTGDLDRDGDIDLVIGPSVWINGGGGRFRLGQTVPLTITTALHLVDIDGDGDLDLLGAALDRETGNADLWLFLNTLSTTR